MGEIIDIEEFRSHLVVPTPDEYIARMVGVFREVWRVPVRGPARYAARRGRG